MGRLPFAFPLFKSVGNERRGNGHPTRLAAATATASDKDVDPRGGRHAFAPEELIWDICRVPAGNALMHLSDLGRCFGAGGVRLGVLAAGTAKPCSAPGHHWSITPTRKRMSSASRGVQLSRVGQIGFAAGVANFQFRIPAIAISGSMVRLQTDRN